MRTRFSLVFLALMLIYAQESLSAAREAFALWQQTVAPSLLPFFAMLPALTAPEAIAVYARALQWPCRLLGFPGELGGAVGIAMAAGSPAGAKALIRIASQKPLPASALFRCALLCAGVSPGFLLSGVGAGMLGDPSAGMILLLAHDGALLLSALLFRLLPLPDAPLSIPKAPEASEPSPIWFSVQNALMILCWMAVFGVGARILQALLPDVCAPFISLLAEFSGGCRYACALGLPREQTLTLLGAVIGFGGVCAGVQNLSALKPLGIPPQMYFAAKLIHASLTALLCRALCDLPIRMPAIELRPEFTLPFLGVLCAGVLLLHLRRTQRD